MKPNPFNTPKVIVDLKRADFLCCEIRAFVEDNHRSTSMDWTFFDSIDVQARFINFHLRRIKSISLMDRNEIYFEAIKIKARYENEFANSNGMELSGLSARERTSLSKTEVQSRVNSYRELWPL